MVYLLDSQPLFEQMAFVIRGVCAQINFMHQRYPFLEWDYLLTVTYNLVTLHLDYCNIPYIGMPLKTTCKCQPIQNAATCLSTLVTVLAHWVSGCNSKTWSLFLKSIMVWGGEHLHNRQSPFSQEMCLLCCSYCNSFHLQIC